jgi:hypothetical protein
MWPSLRRSVLKQMSYSNYPIENSSGELRGRLQSPLIMCSRLLIERATELVSSKPKEGSVLMFAMSKCFHAVVIGLMHGGQLKPRTSFFSKGTGNFFGKP